MRLKNVAIPNTRHSYFLNSVYVGNLRLKSKRKISIERIKKTKVYISVVIFTDIYLCLLLMCRVVLLVYFIIALLAEVISQHGPQNKVFFGCQLI